MGSKDKALRDRIGTKRLEILENDEKLFNDRDMLSARQVRKLLNITAMSMTELKIKRKLVPAMKSRHMIYYNVRDVEAYEKSIVAGGSIPPAPFLQKPECEPVTMPNPLNPEISQKLVDSKEAAFILGYTSVQSFYSMMFSRREKGLPVPRSYGNGKPYYKTWELLDFKESQQGRKGHRRTGRHDFLSLTGKMRTFLQELPIGDSKSIAITPENGRKIQQVLWKVAKELDVSISSRVLGQSLHVMRVK